MHENNMIEEESENEPEKLQQRQDKESSAMIHITSLDHFTHVESISTYVNSKPYMCHQSFLLHSSSAFILFECCNILRLYFPGDNLTHLSPQTCIST